MGGGKVIPNWRFSGFGMTFESRRLVWEAEKSIPNWRFSGFGMTFESRRLVWEAEAGDEAIEAVGVEKIGGDRKVLLEIRPLFLGERSVQFGLKVALFLRELLHPAVRADGALAG